MKKIIQLVFIAAMIFGVGASFASAKDQYIGANYTNSKSYVERGIRYHLISKEQSKGFKQTGKATWYCCYGVKARTADGSKFNPKRLTAAHKTLPFGSKVKVTNLDNRKSVIVEITDRGPFGPGRIIDLTPAAFAQIEAKSKGIANVKIEVQNFK